MAAIGRKTSDNLHLIGHSRPLAGDFSPLTEQTGMFRPIRIRIGKFPRFQTFPPVMRTRTFGRILAYWHGRIMRTRGRRARYVYAYRPPYLHDRTARARGYMREWRKRNPHANVHAWPRCIVCVDLDFKLLS